MKKKDLINNDKYISTFKKMFEVVAIFLLAVIIEYFYFGLNKWNFRIPVTYDGGDAFSGIANMKMRMVGDGYRMGWPYHEDVSMYSPIFNMLSRIGSYIIGIFVDDFYFAQNIFLFMIPVLNVVVCYFVFCSLRIRKWVSLLGAFIYGFCPYVQIRMYLHQDLAAVECIPLIYMLCIWLYEDEEFAKPCKTYLRNKRNILLIFLAWMIANNGIVYYPFFGCFIILITGIMVCVQKKSIRNIISSLNVILNIVFWLLIGFIPAIVGILAGRGDVATNGTTRDAYRATVFGLDIRSLLLSPKGFGIKRLLPFYGYLFEFDNEQYYAYLGIVGIIGFFTLLFFLFSNNFSKNIVTSRIILLSRINVMLLLLGTSCGLGVIVALFIPFIASYNRVSIFIMFACVFTVVMGVDSIIDKKWDDQRKKIALILAVGLLFAVAFWEQMRSYNYFNDSLLEENSTRLLQDKVFFAAMEEKAGENAMIFMLPYMSGFENLQEGNIYDYDHFRGYLNTDTLRWSYGGINESDNDIWYEYTSNLDPFEMIDELRSKGFAGIYINVNGYDDDAGKILANRLLKEIGTNEYILHESGLLIYIPIN